MTKKNNFRKIVFALMLITIFFNWQCQKTADDSPESAKDLQIQERDDKVEFFYKYYLDGNEVNSVVVDSTTDNWIAYVVEPKVGTNDAVVSVRKFSTKNAYIQYGEATGKQIAKALAFAARLQHIADSNGVIPQYELTGTVPSWYSNYESTYYNSVYPASSAENVAIMLDKNCGQGGVLPVLNTWPFMPPTWNNSVSLAQNVGVYAGVGIFDKTFYRKNLGTVWLWGFQSFCFSGTAADDKMSSCIKLL
jgi:hypothetical protein